MWQCRSEFNCDRYYDKNGTVVGRKKTKNVYGGEIKVSSPNYGSVAPVIQSQNQIAASRLPLKMVVSDVVHRDPHRLQIPASSSNFIITAKARTSPYNCSRSLLNKQSHTTRNHYIVDEMQKKFKTIYGSNIQDGVKDLLNTSASLGENLQLETDMIGEERNVPKFSNFYKEFIEKQHSTAEGMGFSTSDVYDNIGKPSSEKKQGSGINQIGNYEDWKNIRGQNEVQFMLAENFLHPLKESSENIIEDDSNSENVGSKAEDESLSSSNEESCSDNEHFIFTPVSNEINQEKRISMKKQTTSKSWNAESDPSGAENVYNKESEFSSSDESRTSYSSEEDKVDWFTKDYQDNELD